MTSNLIVAAASFPIGYGFTAMAYRVGFSLRFIFGKVAS